MRRFLPTVILIVAYLIPSHGQDYDSNIQWMPIEEALKRQKEVPKKLLVEVYTKWCKVCHKLDQLSLSQQHISDYINENYYPVKFDAESKKAIYYMGKKYEFNNESGAGYHAFAYKIMHGKLNYPSLVFLDTDLSVIQSINGFQSPSKLIRILTYFADDYNKKIPWNDFNSQYNSIIYPSSSNNQ